jgi:hypothetical protein
MLNLFEVTGFEYDKGFQTNMSRSGERVIPRNLINANLISSISPVEKAILGEGSKFGVEIRMNNNSTYVDRRSLEEIYDDLKDFMKR